MEALKPIQDNLDAVLEEELARGFRLKDVPMYLQAQVKLAKFEPFARVRFTRINQRRRAKVADAVQRQYFADMKDPGIPSHEQIIKLAEAAGEWNQDLQVRMNALSQLVEQGQQILYLEGISQTSWSEQLLAAESTYRKELDAAKPSDELRQQIIARFDRWAYFTPDKAELYKEKYAAEQGLETYSADRDLAWLLDNLPSQAAAEALQAIEDLKDSMQKAADVRRAQLELHALKMRYERIVAGCRESRRDALEELARLFYCTERVNDKDDPTGPLVAKLEDMWDMPEEVIQWLQVQHYMFVNNHGDEVEEYFKLFYFRQAEPDTREAADQIPTSESNGASEHSDESPVPPTSKLDSLPVTGTAVASSA